MSAPAAPRGATSRSDTQGWRIALGVVALAVAAPWFVFALFLLLLAGAGGDSAAFTASDAQAAALIGAAALVFAAILVPVPLAACWRARRLRTVIVACVACAALSASPVIAFAAMLATSDTPFL